VDAGDLLLECESLPAPAALMDVDDADLMVPGQMLAKINAQLERGGNRPLSAKGPDLPGVANLILHSLAARYAEVLGSVARITGKALKRLFIVGGGSRNKLLNRLTAEHTGLEVDRGSNREHDDWQFRDTDGRARWQLECPPRGARRPPR